MKTKYFFFLVVTLFLNTYSYATSSHLKLLNLVLFSHSEEYDQMYHLTRDYYKNFQDVDTFYYAFSPDHQEPSLEGDILYLPGEESFIPGILDKTIQAFSYFNNRASYDYIIRSNISTIVNFDKVTSLMQKYPQRFQYSGGLLLVLKWLDKFGGIIDGRYLGTPFASGTCIMLSNDAMQKLLSKKVYIDYDIIDDVAIGILFSKCFPEIEPYGMNQTFVFVNDENKDFVINHIDEYSHFRNRSKNRQDDVLQMKELIEALNKTTKQ